MFENQIKWIVQHFEEDWRMAQNIRVEAWPGIYVPYDLFCVHMYAGHLSRQFTPEELHASRENIPDVLWGYIRRHYLALRIYPSSPTYEILGEALGRPWEYYVCDPYEYGLPEA